MSIRHTILAGLAFTSTAAFAAPDLSTTILPPATPYVYDVARYRVRVSNVGNQTANNSSVDIALPTTHTSPQVYIMGDLGAMSAQCSQVGLTLHCNLGNIKRTKNVTVFFDIAFPESSAPLTFTAHADTTSNDPVTGNDDASYTPAQLFYAVSFTGPQSFNNDHCTGQNLTSFYECTLFPGAISSHEAVLEANNTISFPGQDPAYSGIWSRPAPEILDFTYTEYGMVIGTFTGYGVSASCFEGIMSFGGPYLAPYAVCML